MIFGEHIQNRIKVSPRWACASFLLEEAEGPYGPVHQETADQIFIPLEIIKIEIDIVIEEQA